jgi:serine/threonine-protein kinase
VKSSSPKPGAHQVGPLEPGTLVGLRFRVEHKLDAGSLAEVYRATDVTTGRVVALKVLTASHPDHELASRRARREFKAIQKLVHRNVVQIFASGTTPDHRFWIATEYVEGETLRRYLRRHRILAVEDMLPLALQMAEGLSAAHAASVLHRDLKPENIFVLDTGLVKLADFGTARLLADLNAERGTSLGTPAYMAPERLIENGSRFADDPRSDLYSLGIIEYEMLAGYNPVLGEQKDLSRAEVSWRQAAVPPRVPLGVPLEVWSVLEPTLRKEPDRRPTSAHEHALQLERLVRRLGGSREALPAPWAFTPARTPAELFVRRALRSIGAGAALGAIAGGLVYSGWWLGAHHARPAGPAPAPPTSTARERSVTREKLAAPEPSTHGEPRHE